MEELDPQTQEALFDKPLLSCPNCHAVIQLALRCAGVTLVPTDEHGDIATPEDGRTRRHGTAAEQDVIAAARRAGLLEPFIKVVTFVKQDQVPQDMERFFLTFVRSLTPRLIPQYAMDAFNRLFDYHPLEYHSAQGIGVVVVDGAMRLFVPNERVVGTRMRGINRNGLRNTRTLKIDDGKEKLQEWIHTRWGYVAGPGAMLETLHKRSIGEFARPNLSGPG